MDYDLVINGGRLLDPAAGLNDYFDIAFLDGMVVSIQKAIDPKLAHTSIDATDHYVVPGLIDLHTHVYWGGTSLGVDVRTVCSRSGTTTFVDAGSAGAGNFPGFRHFIADSTDLNVFAFLNISYAGIFGFSSKNFIGECRNLQLLDSTECMRTVIRNRDMIVGIKVRLGKEASGRNGTKPLAIAREVADRIQVPIMVHVDTPPPNLRDVMVLLRKGDIWTHCFRPEPNAICLSSGIVEEEITAAKKRGVLFDIGHGYGSFSFDVASKMLGQGLLPDTISSDVHRFSIDERAHHLLHTASKFLMLGMTLEDVVRRITLAPAEVIGQNNIGRLAPGCRGDAVILDIEHGSFVFTDSTDKRITGNQHLRLRSIICNGKLWQCSGHPGCL